MLRYARHYGLARPISFDEQDLRTCKVSAANDTYLQDLATFDDTSLFCHEQYAISRETLDFLQEVFEVKDTSAIACLKRRFTTSLDFPLAKQKELQPVKFFLPDTFEALSRDASCALSAPGSETEDVSADFSKISIAVSKIMDEQLDSDVLEKTFCTVVQAKDKKIEICQLHPRPEATILRVESPLLPVMRMPEKAKKIMQPVLSDCILEPSPDLFDIEEKEFTSEELGSSDEDLEALLAIPDHISSIAPQRKTEPFAIDMPLTPRPRNNATSLDSRILQDLIEDCRVPVSAVSSSPGRELGSILNSCKEQQEHELFAREDFVISDPSLLIPEPELQPVAADFKTHGFPSNFADLMQRQQEDVYRDISVEVSKDSDLKLWTPFPASVFSDYCSEQLMGGEFIEDFVGDTVYRTSIASTSIARNHERATIQNTSPLSIGASRKEHVPRLSTPYKQVLNASSSQGGIDTSSSTAVHSSDHVRFDTLQASPFTKPPSNGQPLTCNEHLLEKDIDETREFMPRIISPVVDENRVGNRQAEYTEVSRDLATLSEACARKQGSSSLRQISSNIQSDDSLLRLARKRVASHDQSSHKRMRTTASSVRAKVNLHMQLRGRQVSEPQSDDRSIEPCISQPVIDYSQVIAPAAPKLLAAEQWWMISTTLLARPALTRALRSGNPLVTLIERDLSSTNEADLILAPSVGLILLDLNQVLSTNRREEQSMRRCIGALHHKYATLLLLMTYHTLDAAMVVRLAILQGWLARVRSVQCMLLRPIDVDAYLLFLTRSHAAQLESLQDEESSTEQFFRQCPFISAMCAQMMARRVTLFEFMRRSRVGKLEVLHHVGLDDAQSLAIARFFDGNWHTGQYDAIDDALDYANDDAG